LAPLTRTVSPWIEAVSLSLEFLIAAVIFFASSWPMPALTVRACLTLSPEIWRPQI